MFQTEMWGFNRYCLLLTKIGTFLFMKNPYKKPEIVCNSSSAIQ